jgi:hypothetical protein
MTDFKKFNNKYMNKILQFLPSNFYRHIISCIFLRFPLDDSTCYFKKDSLIGAKVLRDNIYSSGDFLLLSLIVFLRITSLFYISINYNEHKMLICI